MVYIYPLTLYNSPECFGAAKGQDESISFFIIKCSCIVKKFKFGKMHHQFYKSRYQKNVAVVR